MALTCIAFVLIGSAMALMGRGGERLWGVFAASFFGLCGLAVFVPKGKHTGPGYETTTLNHRNSVEHALAFPLDERRIRTRTLLALGFGLVGGGLALFAEPLAAADVRTRETTIRLIGLAMLVFFGGLGLTGLLRRQTQSLLVLADGIVFQTGSTRTFAPWSSIEGIGVVTMQDSDLLSVALSDRSAVEAGLIARLLMPFNRRIAGAELSYPMDAFVADPGLVLATLHHYLINESDRQTIALGQARPVGS